MNDGAQRVLALLNSKLSENTKSTDLVFPSSEQVGPENISLAFLRACRKAQIADFRISGPAPQHTSYSSFATFLDPDGNGWLFQEVTTRLPGRGLSNLDVAALTKLLQEAEQHHGEYEPTAPKHHWSDWYAAYIVARQNGKSPEEAAKDGKIHIEETL